MALPAFIALPQQKIKSYGTKSKHRNNLPGSI
jgi:hypothetical protein